MCNGEVKKMKNMILSFVIVAVTFIYPFALVDASRMKQEVSKQFDTSNTAVSIRSLQTGSLLFEHRGDVSMRPASNLKLLTGAAALHTLGENYRFSTHLFIDGTVKGTTLIGDIYIKGGGDPTLQPSDIVQFAKVLKREGIQHIDGHVYGDDSFFSGSTLSPGVERWDETYYFGARTSALTLSPSEDFDASTVIVTVHASASGRMPTYSVAPNKAGMTVRNDAKIVQKGQRSTVSIKRKYNEGEIIISGNIPRGSFKKEWVSMHRPTENTLYAIQTILRNTGVTFAKHTSLKRAAVPETARHIYTKESRTLKALYPVFMKLSNNSIADMLVKTMGQEVHQKGDLQSGIRVVRDYAKSLGIPLENWHLIDGSGLGIANKITANGQTLLLTKVKEAPFYSTFYQGMPVGGMRERLQGGTLKNRFTEAPLKHHVIAKTGYITNTYALSGYVTAKSGRTFAFSVMTTKSTSALGNIDAFVKSIYWNY